MRKFSNYVYVGNSNHLLNRRSNYSSWWEHIMRNGKYEENNSITNLKIY